MSQENVELVRQAVARWGADDYAVLLEFIVSSSAPDIELYSRFGGFSEVSPTEGTMACAPGSPTFRRTSNVSPVARRDTGSRGRPGCCQRRDQISGEGERRRYG